MSSVIQNKKSKEKCQIFTPDDIVKEILDNIGYVDSLYGKTILENACGNGQFLKEIVRRYIIDAQKHGLSRTKIKNGLGRDIFGIELDNELYNECIIALNSITDSFGLKRVCWKIKQSDALRDPFSTTFDFVVGNPPYVSYWDLEKSEREFIEKKYTVCQYGAWDYFYAFLQDGFNHLNATGKMAYIIPNSVFKTKSGRKIRELLKPNLTKVLDFTSTNVFETVLTSPAIIVIDRVPKSEEIVYQDISAKRQLIVNRSTLNDEWLFGLQKQSAVLKYRFGDYFRVATSVATQCNDVYVLAHCSDDGTYFLYENYKIEKEIVRKAASPRSKANDVEEYIIFPYYYCNGILKHYAETTFKEKFPFAYEFLESKKDQLGKRAADKNSQWFEYGRSQALMYINQNKLLMSTVITGKVNVYPLDAEEVPYSGVFITVKEHANALSLTKAMNILKSPEFLAYILPRGINAKGSSIRITARDISNYCW